MTDTKLRELAMAIRKKRWEAGHAGAANVVSFDGDDIGPVASVRPEYRDFVAAANPQSVLALLDRLEAAEAVCGRADMATTCFEHADNCCREWCRGCQEADIGRQVQQTALAEWRRVRDGK